MPSEPRNQNTANESAVSLFAKPESQSPGFVLWKVTHRWQGQVVECLAPLGLTHPQFVILACAYWLNRFGGPANQVQIARNAEVEPQAVSQVVRQLEAKELLCRVNDTRDTRAKLVSLTAGGRELAVQSIKAVEAVDAEFFKDVSPAVLKGLVKLM